jgi:hypothetical protein
MLPPFYRVTRAGHLHRLRLARHNRLQVKRVAQLAVVFLLALTAAAKDKSFVMPRLQPAISYPAHDQHTTEKATIAADPYDTHTKLEEFQIPYRQLRFLPVLIIISNEGSEPISMLDLKIELVRAGRVRLYPASEEDILRRFGPVRAPSPSPLPFPLPHGKNPAQILHQEYDASGFKARAVEPGGTQGGFVFFDVSGLADPITGSSLIVSGLKNSAGHDLFFFEIALDKYLGQEPVLQPRN